MTRFGELTDTTKWYLDRISGIPLLGADGERHLAQVIERAREAEARLARGTELPTDEELVKRGLEAKDVFKLSNQGLVVTLARRYPPIDGLDLMDLIQEGNIGLSRAIERFDWRKGFRFSTYATVWIQRDLSRAACRGQVVTVSADRVQELRTVCRANGDDRDRLPPDLAAVERACSAVSIDATVIDGWSLAEVALVAVSDVEHEVIERCERQELVAALGALPPDHRQVLELAFGLDGSIPHSTVKVASAMGLSIRRSRSLLRAACDLLRIRLGDPELSGV